MPPGERHDAPQRGASLGLLDGTDVNHCVAGRIGAAWSFRAQFGYPDIANGEPSPSIDGGRTRPEGEPENDFSLSLICVRFKAHMPKTARDFRRICNVVADVSRQPPQDC